MQPIEVFNTDEELQECLKWWIEKLFLQDWIIKAYICEPCDFEGEEAICGQNSFDMVNKCCKVRILEHRYYGNRIMKYCAEKILLHELLHCKYDWVFSADSYEGKYTDTVEHGLLEQMAKSLIMAKYNVGIDYFHN